MKFRLIENLRPVAIGGFLLVSILGAPNGHGQAPPGPLPQTAPQDGSTAASAKAPLPDVPRTKVLAGTWRLNQEESDDPMKKLQQARGDPATADKAADDAAGVEWAAAGPAAVVWADAAEWVAAREEWAGARAILIDRK